MGTIYIEHSSANNCLSMPRTPTVKKNVKIDAVARFFSANGEIRDTCIRGDRISRVQSRWLLSMVALKGHRISQTCAHTYAMS